MVHLNMQTVKVGLTWMCKPSNIVTHVDPDSGRFECDAG
jgi:hypothetical protein